jgi:phosphoribosylformylglycinamidine cyclo-ligase
MDWQVENLQLRTGIGEALLAVHRCYLPHIEKLRAAQVAIHGLAHITGGGIVDNLPRILPDNVNAIIEKGSWPILPIFNLIQQRGEIDPDEMYRVFNMGVGMLVIVPAEQSSIVQATLPDDCYRIGRIVEGDGRVEFEEV